MILFTLALSSNVIDKSHDACHMSDVKSFEVKKFHNDKSNTKTVNLKKEKYFTYISHHIQYFNMFKFFLLLSTQDEIPFPSILENPCV